MFIIIIRRDLINISQPHQIFESLFPSHETETILYQGVPPAVCLAVFSFLAVNFTHSARSSFSKSCEHPTHALLLLP